ncbi:DUF6366 family protein [Terribacillus sp. DMT04]|uniref:DUF6366 family protein n=1 Tax=Terribacillus sp. DMT04 TaxID=2850441 RepID=UPI001C2B8B5B|nr:DUF6366 family protein [Terribacillus sp. DMT04]QXE02906.1 hypothetical protein KS242_06975 [Terribacillus sp. DMT04]
MSKEKESPKERRERLRQEERKHNPGGNFHDGLNRSEQGNLADLVGGLGWKGTGIILLIIIIALAAVWLFFS